MTLSQENDNHSRGQVVRDRSERRPESIMNNAGWVRSFGNRRREAREVANGVHDAVLLILRQVLEEGEPQETAAEVLGDRAVARAAPKLLPISERWSGR